MTALRIAGCENDVDAVILIREAPDRLGGEDHARWMRFGMGGRPEQRVYEFWVLI